MSRSSITVVGLDLAAANSGLCAIRAYYPDYSFDILHEESFHHPMKDFRNRIAVTDTILERVDKFSPDVVVIEDYARRFGKTNTSGYEHAEVGGMTKKGIIQAGYLLYIMPTTTMRSFMAVPPRSPKNQLEVRAEERLGYKSTASTQKKRSDITDAVIHAHVGSLLYIATHHTLNYELEPSEHRVLYGDKKFVGLVDRDTIEYQEKDKDND